MGAREESSFTCCCPGLREEAAARGKARAGTAAPCSVDSQGGPRARPICAWPLRAADLIPGTKKLTEQGENELPHRSGDLRGAWFTMLLATLPGAPAGPCPAL